MPTQVVGASFLARPVHPIISNRRESGNAAMRQVLSSVLDSWTWAWVLRSKKGEKWAKIVFIQFVFWHQREC